MQWLTLRLMGPVELVGPANARYTPRGMRARGALAIIGSSPGMRVTRARLQDLLFSEREPEHGNASVRQLLREIRISLGDARHALITGPGWVGLDRDIVSVDVAPKLAADGSIPEFASDLDIADPEFEDWLRDARMHAENSYPAEPETTRTGRLPILLTSEPVSTSTEAAVMAAMIIGEAAGRVADLTPIVALPETGSSAASAIVVSSVVARQGDTLNLFVKLSHRPSERLLWSHRFAIPMRRLQLEMDECSAQICLGILRVVEAVRGLDNALSVSFADIFSFSEQRLRRADENLSSIEDRINPAVTLALRAWVRTTYVFERLTADPHAHIQQALELATKARESDPLNATALAVASAIESYLCRDKMSYELARQAVTIDAQNPMARLAYSQALTDQDKLEAARSEAEAGLQQALSSLNPATWHLRVGVALTRLQRYDEAEDHFDAVHQFAPENRPALRFISALRYSKGDEAGAQKALKQLKQLEPDFSLDLMASDEYPVVTLRKLGLLKITKSGLI